jgi:hypothetical protein
MQAQSRQQVITTKVGLWLVLKVSADGQLPLGVIVARVGKQTQHLDVDLPGPPERLQSDQATFGANQFAQLSQPAMRCEPAGQLIQGVVIAGVGAFGLCAPTRVTFTPQRRDYFDACL